MTCKRGDLIGIPFPYSDLSTKKIAKNYGTVCDTALQDVMERVCEYLGCIRNKD